jgi:hypothetical protein
LSVQLSLLLIALSLSSSTSKSSSCSPGAGFRKIWLGCRRGPGFISILCLGILTPAQAPRVAPVTHNSPPEVAAMAEALVLVRWRGRQPNLPLPGNACRDDARTPHRRGIRPHPPPTSGGLLNHFGRLRQSFDKNHIATLMSRRTAQTRDASCPGLARRPDAENGVRSAGHQV